MASPGASRADWELSLQALEELPCSHSSLGIRASRRVSGSNSSNLPSLSSRSSRAIRGSRVNSAAASAPAAAVPDGRAIPAANAAAPRATATPAAHGHDLVADGRLVQRKRRVVDPSTCPCKVEQDPEHKTLIYYGARPGQVRAAIQVRGGRFAGVVGRPGARLVDALKALWRCSVAHLVGRYSSASCTFLTFLGHSPTRPNPASSFSPNSLLPCTSATSS
jgi:hypothetical protein